MKKLRLTLITDGAGAAAAARYSRPPPQDRAILSYIRGLREMCPHVELPANLRLSVTPGYAIHAYTLIAMIS